MGGNAGGINPEQGLSKPYSAGKHESYSDYYM